MKSGSVPPQRGLITFEDVLSDRLMKQNQWIKKYTSIPLIEENSKVIILIITFQLLILKTLFIDIQRTL